MKRLSALVFTVVALSLTATGVASADALPIWALPGIDVGSLLGPTTGVPGGLAPVFDLLKLIGG